MQLIPLAEERLEMSWKVIFGLLPSVLFREIMRLKIVPNVGYNGDDDDVLPGGSEPDVGEGLLGLEQDEEGHHQPPGHKSSYSCF